MTTKKAKEIATRLRQHLPPHAKEFRVTVVSPTNGHWVPRLNMPEKPSLEECVAVAASTQILSARVEYAVGGGAWKSKPELSFKPSQKD